MSFKRGSTVHTEPHKRELQQVKCHLNSFPAPCSFRDKVQWNRKCKGSLLLISFLFQDIAVLVDNTSLCDFYQSESFNLQPRQYCREEFPNGDPSPFSEANTEEECSAIAGESACGVQKGTRLTRGEVPKVVPLYIMVKVVLRKWTSALVLDCCLTLLGGC